jgi:single-strand DNA-binding protein
MYLNNVQIIGRTVRTPEIKYLTTGTPVCTFSLANSFKDKPEYYNCEAWDKQAEFIAQYVEQGQLLYVEGRLRTDSRDKDGVTHYRTKIVVERVSFGPKKSRVPGEDDEKVFSQEQSVDDDVPF